MKNNISFKSIIIGLFQSVHFVVDIDAPIAVGAVFYFVFAYGSAIAAYLVAKYWFDGCAASANAAIIHSAAAILDVRSRRPQPPSSASVRHLPLLVYHQK